MRVWVLVLENRTEPEQKVYIVGAYSTADAAKKRRAALETPGQYMAHVVEVEVDGQQPPVLIGVGQTELPQECKKNTPNG